MAEAYQAGHSFMQVAVTWRELVSVDKQEDEIQLIGAVSVRRMAFCADAFLQPEVFAAIFSAAVYI